MLGMNFSSFWDIFAIPFGYVMQGLNYICGRQYLLALLLFSLVVKLVTLPVAIKQQKTQIKGAMLRPKMMLIEKKYAGRTDQKTLQKKQQEIMELQQKEGYSPLSGCLPLLLQFPVIIGLYRIIRMPLKYVMSLDDNTILNMYNQLCNPKELATSLDGVDAYAQINMIDMFQNNNSLLNGFVGNIEEFVSKLPNFDLFGLNTGITPTLSPKDSGLSNLYLLFILIPVISGALNYLTMFISRKINDNGMNAAMNPQQSSMNTMTMLMPLLSAVFAFMVPAAVGIYWIYSSIFGIIQTLILAKVMPLPKFTEEEIRAMQREIKAGRGDRNITSSSVDSDGRPRSLHYADDDDEY